ncbi:hypothetical protein [Micromonospora auratinigra]|uniref:Uncharacterized protein n=1 Tax=Micromonospora auratinigra TaxID=261654 RepID=A0A1A8Z5R0_9ACTN|nr:hypothetical protein [Micromonospora auratinigra]SBT39187.1 hypothetical protein GA0070611_0821 [Micromonospora auratinigra]
MSDDTDDSTGWRYAPTRTLVGALQRGLGRGAHRALVDPAAPEAVLACLRRDHRWFWQIDERAGYLARLVRDLRLPVAPMVAGLAAAAPDPADDDNQFQHTLDVLVELGRIDYDGTVAALRDLVREGDRWHEVLASLARDWPVDQWDDLYDTVADRLGDLDPAQVHWLSPPWPRWADRDRRIADAVAATRLRPGPARPFAGSTGTALLDLLGDATRTADWRPALRELRRRPPEPALLDLVDPLLAADVGYPLHAALTHLGPLAVPAARHWATAPRHPLHWTALLLLAEHGEARDAGALLDGLAWLDGRPDDLCGYDRLLTGLVRLDTPRRAEALPWLRRLWFSPHSYERAAYLRARLRVDADDAARCLREGLWDCEADVRLLAARHVALGPEVRDRLRALRDDLLETPEVRAAAAARI